jgi:hypothetical protein
LVGLEERCVRKHLGCFIVVRRHNLAIDPEPEGFGGAHQVRVIAHIWIAARKILLVDARIGRYSANAWSPVIAAISSLSVP